MRCAASRRVSRRAGTMADRITTRVSPGRRHSFWSNVAAVAYKEASVVRHDKALLATVFAQPVMMLLLFGLALSNKPANVPWLVLDRSQTALSRRLVEEIQATGYFLPPRAAVDYEEGR